MYQNVISKGYLSEIILFYDVNLKPIDVTSLSGVAVV